MDNNKKLFLDISPEAEQRIIDEAIADRQKYIDNTQLDPILKDAILKYNPWDLFETADEDQYPTRFLIVDVSKEGQLFLLCVLATKLTKTSYVIDENGNKIDVLADEVNLYYAHLLPSQLRKIDDWSDNHAQIINQLPAPDLFAKRIGAIEMLKHMGDNHMENNHMGE